jgi:hypothetical protein
MIHLRSREDVNMSSLECSTDEMIPRRLSLINKYLMTNNESDSWAGV